MHTLPKVSFRLAAAGLIALNGCGDTSTSPTGKIIRLDVNAVSQTSISGIVGAVASPAPQIRVTDSVTHEPLANVPVEFRIVDGVGRVTGGNTMTDAAGLASPGAWTFGTTAGFCHLKVFVNGTARLSFTATLKADVADHLVPSLDLTEAALAGSSIDGPLVVVVDKFSNRVSGTLVSFAIVDGGGTLEMTSAKASADGLARAGVWKIGSTPGRNRAIATLGRADTTGFDVEGLDAATIKWYQVDTVRDGSRAFPPSDLGIVSARLGITPFDTCLCKKQDGYFIEEFISGSGDDSYVSTDAGRYSLDGRALTIPYLAKPGSIDGTHLYLQRPNFDLGSLVTWVYTEISGN